jgi:hypothetical protein
MKYALQIYGEFRCFEKCIEDILYFIDYYNKDFDVFILTQKNSSTFSYENLKKIKDILGEDRIKMINFIEDYSESIMKEENILVNNYFDVYNKFILLHQENVYSSNEFVTRLWYRRNLNNDMRIAYEKLTNTTYDYVVRTRFDIGFIDNKQVFEYSVPLYILPDIITISSPDIINIESSLYKGFPFTPIFMYDNYYKLKDNNRINYMFNTLNNFKMSVIHPKWVFMSEVNLLLYLHINLDIKYHTYIHNNFYVLEIKR